MERFSPDLKEKYPQLYYEHIHRYLIAREHIKGRVLDLACGEGYGTSILAEKADSVLGLDINSDAISRAREIYKENNISFHTADCTNTQLKEHTFDCIVSFETIEHLDSPAAFVSEIKRLLKPNGLLIISSPDKREYTEANAIENIHHINELYHEEFKELLGANFIHCHFSKQRLVAGSLIQADTSKDDDSFGIHKGKRSEYKFSNDLERGLYSFAICSEEELPKINLGLFENKELSNFAWEAIEQYRPTLNRLRKAEMKVRESKPLPSVDSLLNAIADIELQNEESQKLKKLAEKRTEQFQSKIKELESELVQRKKELIESNRERDNLKERYQRLLSTASWKLTVPIRSIRRFFERKNQK